MRLAQISCFLRLSFVLVSVIVILFLFRPSGTLVPVDLCFSADVFIYLFVCGTSPDSMPVLVRCWLRYGKSGQPTVGYQRCASTAPVSAPLYTGVISAVWTVDYTKNYKYFLSRTKHDAQNYTRGQ